MRLDWIDDILAVIDTGSLARAAERRALTQSAFTRRVRGIEDSLGASLFDRSRKPVVMTPGVRALEPELREMSARLRRLRHDLRSSGDSGGVAFVCQHSITATISPWIVKELTARGGPSVRVRSGNRDECLMLLLSGEVDFALTYEVPEEPAAISSDAFETVTLGVDRLIPVCAPDLLDGLCEGAIPTIGYPHHVFLGRIVNRHIVPRLPAGMSLSLRAETALTLAACEYALDGIGVAWLPATLVAPHLDSGRLVRVETLPEQPLGIAMIRMSGSQRPGHESIEGVLADHPAFSSAS
ncbi:MAG: LysR family transcriptional regulator [Jannaschia sp.]